jgi:histidyl-tRNA synthetase
MGGQPTPGIGFALGVERLLMELQQQQATMPEPAGITVYIAALGSGAAAEARRWTLRLRTLGVRAETDLLQRSLKAQLKYAGKLGVRYTVVIGEDEIKTGKIKFKDMRQHSEQEMSFEQAEQLLIEGDE